MRLAIASDIHGSAKWCEKFLCAADEENADAIEALDAKLDSIIDKLSGE